MQKPSPVVIKGCNDQLLKHSICVHSIHKNTHGIIHKNPENETEYKGRCLDALRLCNVLSRPTHIPFWI